MTHCRISLLPVILLLQLVLLIGSGIANAGEQALPADYCQWAVSDYAIAQPLCGLDGNASRGMAIASDSGRGNCLACHQLPIPDVEAYGTIGPPLSGIGARLTEGQIRLRVVDTREINPM
jgi:sulfur-oxidizing protein SoxX